MKSVILITYVCLSSAIQRCVDTRLNKPEPQKTTSDPTAEDRKPVSSKTAVFVPPFRKNVKLEPQGSSGLQDKTRAPGVFVSPFLKNNRLTREGSFKPSEDNHSPFISEMPTKTTSVPLPEYNPITDTGSDNAKESIKEQDPQNIDKTDRGDDCGHCLPVTLGGEGATAEDSIAGQLAPDATGTLLDVVYGTNIIIYLAFLSSLGYCKQYYQFQHGVTTRERNYADQFTGLGLNVCTESEHVFIRK